MILASVALALAAASPAFADEVSGMYDVKYEEVSTNCPSPLKYVQKVKTPTLVLHSDNDFRVPIEQGEQWFRALQHFGVTSELVMFPRENHNLTRTGEPKHLVESLNWQCYWFDRFLNGNAAAKASQPALDATSVAVSSEKFCAVRRYVTYRPR